MRYANLLILVACLLAAALGLKLGHFKTPLTSVNTYQILPTTFAYWDAEPVTSHLGLSFASQDDVERGRAYPHFTAVWLGLLYVCLKPLELMGVPYPIAQNAVVFLTFAILLSLIVATTSRAARQWSGDWTRSAFAFLLVVLAFCIVATLPALWVASLLTNPEAHEWFIAPIGVAFLSVLDFERQPPGRAGFLICVGIALIAPVHAAFLFLALVFLATPVGGSRFSGVEWHGWKRQGLVFGMAIAFSVVSPYLAVWLGGWESVGSGVLFRSGLDGSTEYFTTILQAVFFPSYSVGRQWHLVPLLVAAPLMAAGMFIFSRSLAERMLRQLIFCWAPALLWTMVFPQLISIHPYHADFGLLFPPAFCIAFWLCQAEVQGILFERRALSLATFIGLIGLLVSNYLDLSRAG